MDRNVKSHRKSLSLGQRINQRQSANINANDDTHPQGIDEPKSPVPFERASSAEATPPHMKFSLDESLEYSPMCLNNSLSPSMMCSQTTAIGNSEVGWQWENKHDKKVITVTDYSSNSGETKDFERHRHKKREDRLRAIEYKMRRAENTRAAQLLKKRCEQFEKQLKEANDESKHKKSSVQPKTVLDLPKVIKDTPTTAKSIDPKTFDDFFNDSDTDDFLLVASQQVEHEIKQTEQSSAAVPNDLHTPSSSKNKKKEKRSSMYIKFLEDDSPDDLFGSLDDIIAQAMENTKPKNSFQRFNSMPVESMSPKSNRSHTSQKISNISKSLENHSSEDNHTMKRHASTHDVQIYHPQKMKQRRI